ncbi:transposase [Kallotenue papyrolyticum]|uniref:transposase n=1 Tax=Kallotenue papyrolyticum TaxID=1325125 RepID=UPI0013779FE9|nr:transposase [Kallotenue papyrolyticum]
MTRINDCLREDIRTTVDKEPKTCKEILDSQSVKTVSRGEERGFDSAKQVKGRKRYYMVDTLGLLILLLIPATNVQDSDAGQELRIDARYKSHRLKKIYADQGHKQWLVDWIQQWLAFVVEVVVKPSEQRGFQVHPKYWIVERFFAWLNMYRRLSKDYEQTVSSSEGVIYLASIHIMARKLVKLQHQTNS